LLSARSLRVIKLWTIAAGTSEIQTLTIAKDLLRERGFVIDLAGGHSDQR
jgi:alkylation response protein AidB-like acyl-CoA dehydrogenase